MRQHSKSEYIVGKDGLVALQEYRYIAPTVLWFSVVVGIIACIYPYVSKCLRFSL